MRLGSTFSLAIFLLGAAGCRSGGNVPAPPVATSAGPSPSKVAAATPEDELGRLDTRVEVPLLPMMANHQKQNMREHLVALREIIAGVSAEDFERIDAASKKIGFSEQMGVMCTHMGAGAPGFTDRALAFHHTADAIGAAARRHDMKRVLSALAETTSACTDCHATFKQRVVDAATFAALTGTSGEPKTHPSPAL